MPHGAYVTAIGEFVGWIHVFDRCDMRDAHGVDGGIAVAVGRTVRHGVVVELVTERFRADVRKCCRGWKLEEYCEEGVLEKDSLPELAPLLFIAS